MDPFSGFGDNVESPARHAVAVTPNDGTALPYVTKALYIGGAGNVTVRPIEGGADCTFSAVPAGSILPVRVSHVRATGTSATMIVALG